MAASRAFWTTLRQSDHIPLQGSDWDDYKKTLQRYAMLEALYHNTLYEATSTLALALKYDRKLYKFVRGIYNPAERLVETYVSKIYGGALDLENLEKGAMPIRQADSRLRDAIRQVCIWSNWGNYKSLWVRQCANLGDGPVKIVTDNVAQKVRLEVLHPTMIKEITYDAVGNVKRIVIEYEVSEDTYPDPTRSTKKTDKYLYTEVIDQSWFETFKNGDAFPFYSNDRGEAVSRWPNDYGFVPVAICKHRDAGFQRGMSAFSNNGISKIHEINDQASLLNDQIRKAVNVIWGVVGGNASDITIATPKDANNQDKRDTAPIISIPEGASITPLIAPLDIAATGQNIQNMLMELERDMPELSLARVRDGGNLTAPGVKAGWSDAIERIVEARGNYDATLIRLFQMAVTIGGVNRYRGFEAYDINSYDDGDLDFYIAERPVIEESLTVQERINFWLQSEAPKSKVWQELGATKQEIQAWSAPVQRPALDVTDDELSAAADQLRQLGLGQPPPMLNPGGGILRDGDGDGKFNE